MSEAARGLRILCEYAEPERRFRQTGVRNTVAFFGSARVRAGFGADGRDWYAETAKLAEKLAAWTLEQHEPRARFFICTGVVPVITQAAHARGPPPDSPLTVGLHFPLPIDHTPTTSVHSPPVSQSHPLFTSPILIV